MSIMAQRLKGIKEWQQNVKKEDAKKDAVKTLIFPSPVHRNVDTEYPVVLCEEHAKEVHKFAETDVAGVKEWLKADPQKRVS